MKKKITSLAFALLLLLSCMPGAYAMPLAPLGSAAEPLVYTCADISCRTGDTAVLSITAESQDGGSLGYQWYRSIDGSNMNGSMIINATSSTYYADTSRTGTNYYFCIVTNYRDGYEASVISAPIAVKVESGAPVIEGIGVLTRPNKIEYQEGDRLDTTGLSVRVYTDQGYYDVTGGLECSPAVLDVAGTQTVTVRYEGKSCTFTVTVEAAKETVESISVASMPSKTSYTVGDSLDTAGLVIRVVTNKQVQDITDGFSCTPKVLTTAGTQQIRVIYGITSTTFSVTVAERATATPAPTVSPSSTPAAAVSPSVSPAGVTGADGSSPSPAPTRHVSSHQSHETNAGSAVIQIILVLALLALVGLGAYVYTVQRKNKK